MKNEPDFSFLRYISDLGLERTGLAGGEARESPAEIKKGFWERNPKLKKRIALAGVGLIASGIGLGIYAIENKNNKLNSNIYEDMKNINKTLYEKNFLYQSDDLIRELDVSKITPYNSTITGYSSFGLSLSTKDNKIPKNIKKFQALKNLGILLSYNNKEYIQQSSCYEVLTAEKENYPIDISVPLLNHPEDITPPSQLIKTRRCDCEDYALLYANYYTHKKTPAFLVLDKHHIVTALGEIPSNPKELKKNIKNEKSIIIGSSEYLTDKNLSTEEILNNLKTKYSSENTEIALIISKDEIWTKENYYGYNNNLFKYSDTMFIKKSVDYLGMNLSDIQIGLLVEEYYGFERNLIDQAIELQVGEDKEYYLQLQKMLNNPEEIKTAGYLFNESSFKESSR